MINFVHKKGHKGHAPKVKSEMALYLKKHILRSIIYEESQVLAKHLGRSFFMQGHREGGSMGSGTLLVKFEFTGTPFSTVCVAGQNK